MCIYSNKSVEFLESTSDSYHPMDSSFHSYSEARYCPMIEYVLIIEIEASLNILRNLKSNFLLVIVCNLGTH